MKIVPVSFREANAFVRVKHRHNGPVRGCKFCLGIEEAGELVGVAMVGRPVARMLQDGRTLEVNRSCTDGTRNANSKLYRACWKAARALGYERLVTYNLPEETGESLRGAGYTCIGEAGGGTWNRLIRPRLDKHPTQTKIRWQIEAAHANGD